MKASVPQSKFQFGPFIISLFITLTIGFVGSLFIKPQISGWYSTLQKSSLSPPDWLFAPVWTILYILIAIAAYLVWEKRDSSDLYPTARLIYFFQLLLNFLWSIIFFVMHQMLTAIFVIVLLWTSIIAIMYYFGLFSKAASWLLLPYLIWVTYAGILNFSVYMLNR